MTIENIAKAPFEHFISEKEALRLAEIAHSEMYDKLLERTGTKADFGAEKGAHLFKMKLFINKIYSSKDTVGRGINLNDKSSVEKLKRHLTFLRDVKNNEICNRNKFIMNLLASRNCI